jgi:hypothetical protein
MLKVRFRDVSEFALQSGELPLSALPAVFHLHF